MAEVVVVVGPAQIGRALARQVDARKHVRGAVAVAFSVLLLGELPHGALAQAAATSAADRTHSIGGVEFVRTPAGRFLIGSPDSVVEALPFEKPQHEVTISAFRRDDEPDYRISIGSRLLRSAE